MYQNLAILAAFLLLYSVMAGRIDRSRISGPIVFCAAGMVLGPGGTGVLRLGITTEGLRLLAEATLAMVLFTDAAHADLGVIRRSIGVPERLLLIGLPLTILLGTAIAWILFPDLRFLEVAVLATMLAPTDAALGKPVAASPAVPAMIRESLNLESGLNDGICVPVIVILLGLAVGTQMEHQPGAHVAIVVAEEIGIGLLVGLPLAALAAWVFGVAAARGWSNAA
jgi:sodium/hydrogen antiporter